VTFPDFTKLSLNSLLASTMPAVPLTFTPTPEGEELTPRQILEMGNNQHPDHDTGADWKGGA
jgi:hypothetical protein